MPKILKIFVLSLILILAVNAVFIPQPSAEEIIANEDTVNVLFIGNSYTFTNDMPNMLEQIAKSKGKNVKVNFSLCIGGASLEQLWNRKVQADAIREGNWDYVVLQEHGSAPLQGKDRFFKYTRLFDAEIKAAGAKTILFVTYHWIYDNDWNAGNKKLTQSMQNQLNEAYKEIGDEIQAIVAPVGQVWVEAFKNEPNINLYQDTVHPNKLGAYLTACIFYSTIFLESPEGASFNFEMGKNNIAVDLSGDPELIINLQKLAWETVSALVPPRPTPTEKKKVVATPTPSERKEVVVLTLKVGSADFEINRNNTIENMVLDAAPEIKNSRTFLPIRAVVEALGGTVTWDAGTQKIGILQGEKTIDLWIGKFTAIVSGVEKSIDTSNEAVTPYISPAGRTMVPVRFVSENLGAAVEYHDATQTITIKF